MLSRGCTRAFRGASLHRPRAGKELKGDSRAPTLACPSDTTAAADGQAPASGSAGKAAALQGTYRVSLTEKELADSPLLSDQGEINDQNWGQLTLKLSDGRVRYSQSNDRDRFQASGRYETDDVAGHRQRVADGSPRWRYAHEAPSTIAVRDALLAGGNNQAESMLAIRRNSAAGTAGAARATSAASR